MGNRHRRAAKASSSALLLMIIAAAVLAFIPFRVTLAVGSKVSIFAPAYILQSFVGTHVDIDSLGILFRTVSLRGSGALSTILANFGLRAIGDYIQATGKIPLVGNQSTLLPVAPVSTDVIGFRLNVIDYFAIKVQKVTIDIAVVPSSSVTGLLQPFGSGPSIISGSGKIIQVRLVAVSMTISGYNRTSTSTNKYGEDNLDGLNQVFLISFDRLFLDLFLDPATDASTYILSADMTVYQAIAMAFEGVLLG